MAASQDTYRGDSIRPLQQGDIFITSGVVRLAPTSDSFAPPAWIDSDQIRNKLAEPTPLTPGLDSVGGRALVMVLSHDCHLDKEINIAAQALLRADPNLGENDAYAAVENDDTLDRFVIVSPLVDLDLLPVARNQNARVGLLSGRTVGYFPLPQAPSLNLDGVVVDLSYRATVDRLTLTRRLTSLTDPARLRLRYALARMDSLRTPDLNSDFQEAVGQKIIDVKLPSKGQQTIKLVLDNGKTLEVLPKPGDTTQDGPRRRKIPKKTSR